MRRVAGMAALLLGACLVAAATMAREQPLSKDDVTLLLLGGATPEKMIGLIEQRGVDFQMNPDFAKRFHDAGASDEVIEALQKAGKKLAQSKSAASAAPSGQPGGPPADAIPSGQQVGPAGAANAPPTSAAEASTPTAQSEASVKEKIKKVMDELGGQPEGGESSAVYQPAPAFSLTDIFGRRLSLADYQNKVVLLDFWATWCGPCRSEIPHFVELQEQLGDEGLAIIGIALDDRPAAVKEFYKQYSMNYPVAMGDRQVRAAYGGIAALPTTFLIGRDRRIHLRLNGAPDVGYIKQEIQTLLAAQSHPPAPAPSVQPVSAASTSPSSQPAPAAQAATPAAAAPAAPAPSQPAAHPVSRPVESLNLSDPSPEQVQKIIQEFAAKEELFKGARNNYTYHQVNKVQTLDADGSVDGQYQQDWDILYDDAGKRIERVTYAPPDTLRRLQITREDLDAFRSIQPFVLTTEELPEYDIKYMGHVKVDEITAYVFSVRPRELKKGRQYFQGVVWVDDRDLQIVKSEGKNVPELKTKGGENLFPRFTTYREQIDGKFWFPTYTEANDTLHFSIGPVRIREIVKYTDYKQFKSTTKTRVLSEVSPDQNKTSAQSQPKK